MIRWDTEGSSLHINYNEIQMCPQRMKTFVQKSWHTGHNLSQKTFVYLFQRRLLNCIYYVMSKFEDACERRTEKDEEGSCLSSLKVIKQR
jgi:hypothetical protein